MRLTLGLTCLVVAGAAAPAHSAPAPARVDRDHGVRFELAGEVLTVGLTTPASSGELWGRRIRAVCSPTFSYRQARRAVHAVQLWPSGADELTYQFERDISERVKWCLLEDVGGGDLAGVDFAVFIRVFGSGAKDRRIGRQLRAYLLRNAAGRPWLKRVDGIVVDRGVIAVTTGLRHNRTGKRAAREICNLIQGADVADFTPGHTVFGPGDRVLKRCRAREG